MTGLFIKHGGKAALLLVGVILFALFLPFGFPVTAYAEIEYKTAQVFDCHYKPKTGEGYAGYAVHVHTMDCFNSYYERVCELPLIPPHTHSESCYDAEGTLICGQLELHTHTDACWKNGKLVCGRLELEEHVHGPECFKTVIVEVDTDSGEEHVVSEPLADLETEEDWEETLGEVKLTGDRHSDLVAIAKSQLGYHQSKTNVEVNGEFKGGHYNRYGAWYGYPYGDWCAMFVSFCLHYAGIPKEVFPYDSGTINWVDTLKNLDMFGSNLEYVPVPGDVVFFDFDDGRADHVGIVTAVEENGTLRTIEGNRTSSVEEFEYPDFRHNVRILGYGILP